LLGLTIVKATVVRLHVLSHYKKLSIKIVFKQIN